MKKVFSVLLCCGVCLSFAACGANSTLGSDAAQDPTPPDLTGEWKQTNSDSDDSWQAAMITDDTIEVYWVSDNGDTKSLYWAGSFESPTDDAEPYTWESENDHDKTDSALLASPDDTKTFTYESGELSYEVSALGTTTTVRLEKQ